MAKPLVQIGLIYHDVAASSEQERCGFPGPAAARYKLTPDQFERHLDAIEGSGVVVGPAGSASRVSITFDDGGSSALAAAAALERRGWRGHFFVTTGRIDTPGFLSADGVRELAARGHEVGSHSDSHPTYMGALDRAALAAEWGRSRDRLHEILNAPPTTAAVPGGFLSDQVIEEAAAAGYRLLMTSQPSTRVRVHHGMEVRGRFTVWSATTPERVAAYARGDLRARASMWLGWQSKSLSKRLSPAVYEGLRQRWAALGRRSSG